MIIICACGEKKFNVDDSLIPEKGRNIQCGACDRIWFYKKPDKNLESTYEFKEDDNLIDKEIVEKKLKKIDKNLNNKIDKPINTKDTALVEYKKKSNFSLNKLLSYIIVVIISFIGLILIIDTFKVKLYKFFPNLEFLLFSLFETLKDINLFIIDLI
tara:strand:- start:683 stop:1153 length:471 start_codon:yes stop_codon:yes gene_type:complete